MAFYLRVYLNVPVSPLYKDTSFGVRDFLYSNMTPSLLITSAKTLSPNKSRFEELGVRISTNEFCGHGGRDTKYLAQVQITEWGRAGQDSTSGSKPLELCAQYGVAGRAVVGCQCQVYTGID